MVANVTSLTTNGLRDWIIQRVSAVILAAYTFFLLYFFITTPEITYKIWSELFAKQWVAIFTTLSLIALIMHTWIGMWTVMTDYLKSTKMRLLFQFIVRFTLVICLLWGIKVVWSL